MRWQSDEILEFDGVEFFVTFDSTKFDKKSSQAQFILLKARQQIDQYQKLSRSFKVERMFELGIWQGGSVVFYEKLFHPRKLVAIDLSPPIAALDEYLAGHSLGERIKPFYHVDQGDRARLQEILEGEFPGQSLDLVVDDASHFLLPTRASFNVLFPRLRAGGFYVIEDWGWEHWPGMWQTPESPFAGSPALTNLIFELVMTAASRGDIVAGLSISNNMVTVSRGPAALGADFDISSSYLIRDPQEIGRFAALRSAPFIDRHGNVVRRLKQVLRRVPALERALRSVTRRLRDH